MICKASSYYVLGVKPGSNSLHVYTSQVPLCCTVTWICRIRMWIMPVSMCSKRSEVVKYKGREQAAHPPTLSTILLSSFTNMRLVNLKTCFHIIYLGTLLKQCEAYTFTY